MEKQNKKETNTLFGKIKATFQRKSFRAGVYTTVTGALVIVAVIILNLVASATKIEKDLTSGSKNSLTKETKELLSGLEDDLTFYYLTKEGQMLDLLDSSFDKFIELYQKESDKIKFETVDLLLNPKFAEAYTDQAVIQYSMIVVNERTKLSKYISSQDMVLTETALNTQTFQYESRLSGVDIEGQVNAAIRYVTSGQQINLYAVTGHGELLPGSEGENILRKANINYSKLETMTIDSIPEDCDVLFIGVPAKDYTETEVEMLKAYADKGGDFFLLVMEQEGLTNFDKFLTHCGFEIGHGVIVEGDSKYHNPSSSLELYPALNKSHPVTERLSSGYYFPMRTSYSLSRIKGETRDIIVTGLLTTSEDAYLKDVNNGKVVLTKAEGDTEGPFHVGVYVNNKETGSEAIVLASPYAIYDQYLQIANYANAGFFTSSINYMAKAEIAEAIRTVDFDSEEMLTINAAQANLVAVVLVISIPVLLVIAGIYVMLRRRSR
ncbi:MAG: GldG family protein [Lachnospiraceae bacterium]|nr:GldG family protein [Lachnospiraceae bacterium]